MLLNLDYLTMKPSLIYNNLAICLDSYTQHAGEKRGVAGLLLGRTERAARAAELQLCARAAELQLCAQAR